MTELVTLAQAKAHLRITTPPGHVDDPDIQLKLDGATVAVTRYVGRTAHGLTVLEAWVDPASTDPDAQAAILIQLGELWRFRGDDTDLASDRASRWEGHDLSPVVVGLLRRFCDPVLA